MYGISTQNNLVSINPETGTLTNIGTPYYNFQLVEGLGDIDYTNGIYYIVNTAGDISTVVGLNLDDGSMKVNISLSSLDGSPLTLAVDQSNGDVFLAWADGSDPSHSTYQAYQYAVWSE